MSLDWSLNPAACPTCKHVPHLEDLNLTRNLVPMELKAGVYEALRDEGAPAGKHVETLEKGIKHFYEHRDEYELLNSENGWGDTNWFISFLEKALQMSKDNPTAIIHAWY